MNSSTSGQRYDAAEVVERIRRVPDSARQFTQSRADARRLHRIDETLLVQLLDLGLPCRGRAAGLRLDGLDLANAGLALRLACPRWLAMRWWARSLAQTASGLPVRYETEMLAPCPTPGHPGPCRYMVHPALIAGVDGGSVRRVGLGRYAFELTLPGGGGRFEGAAAELLDRVRQFQFHLLPAPLDGDLGFLAHSGLADCLLASLYLTRTGGQFGLSVRAAGGYFMALPYAVPHVWVEVELDGRWLPADPFLLTSLARWGIVDPAAWPPNRMPVGVLWPLANGYIDVISHNGSPVEPSLAVRSQQPVTAPGNCCRSIG